MSELYRDYIDGKADEIINSLGGTITPAPANSELYRDFLDRKFTDVQNCLINVLPIGQASGNPATFNTSLALPLVACTTEFMCTQEGSGDPSPSNPRAIVGVDDITLTINGNTVVIDLDGTKYGGYVDVVNGVAHVKWIKNVITQFTGWSVFNTYKMIYNTTYLSDNPPVIADVSHLKCENLKPINLADRSNNIGNFIYLGASGVSLSAPDCETRAEYDAWIADNPVTFIYELAEPFDIQLTPTQIETLIGDNSFASDTENIDIKYRCLPIDLI